MKKQKKDFWNMSWNPVWGCLNSCIFCYARRIAKRYADQIAKKEIEFLHDPYGQGYVGMKTNLWKKLFDFKPTWLESNYVRKFPPKPSIIFVNSMSDPAYWEQEWYERIVEKIAKNMQHTFVVLTKQPGVYWKYHFPHNTIIGITCTCNNDFEELIESEYINYFDYTNQLLLSIEPIQEKINEKYLCKDVFDWIHVGQESGNRVGRIVATREMIQPFFDLKDIPVFMKNNLAGICGDRPLRKEFPEL